MLHVFLHTRNLVDRDEGYDLAEYASLFGLISIVAMMAVSALCLNLLAQWNKLAALVGGMS